MAQDIVCVTPWFSKKRNTVAEFLEELAEKGENGCMATLDLCLFMKKIPLLGPRNQLLTPNDGFAVVHQQSPVPVMGKWARGLGTAIGDKAVVLSVALVSEPWEIEEQNSVALVRAAIWADGCTIKRAAPWLAELGTYLSGPPTPPLVNQRAG